MRRLLIFTLAPIMALLLAACAPAAPGAGGPLNVVATTGQIGDAVRFIGGDAIGARTLLGPGIDPHTYVATEGDLRTFQNADVIFYNGLHLEAQIERVLEQIGQRTDATVVALGDGLDEASLLSWEPENGFPHDPHVWNDVQLWKGVVEQIGATLAEADPANAEQFRSNTQSYLAQLDELDAYIRAEAARIPAERRVIVTAHDAFGYFARAYDFEVEAIQGISTEAEAATADIQAIARLVVERQVPAIFVESTISPRTVEAVQEAVRAAGHEVAVGGQLYSDALGAADGPAGTYVGMMRSNIDTLVGALAG
ncbi:MAG TPA: zinc ABC transporter substrate-binding protein [Chloroflexaceae bacterium]|nr:zinc ABC transporter substrate-binding protein [Chloroflexaceae bacterium]